MESTERAQTRDERRCATNRKVLHLIANRSARETNTHESCQSSDRKQRGIELHRRRNRLNGAPLAGERPVVDMRKQFFFSSAAADRDFFSLR